jgi:hypothetical protein
MESKNQIVLTSLQIAQIRQRLKRDGVTLLSLQDDLLDHLCCLVELKIRSGEDFNRSLDEALHELAPSGLHDIQQQTEFLIYPIKIIMKKVFYFIAMATTISMTMGIMFKLLHMPGGEQLFNYGFLTFSVLCLPALAVEKFRRNNQHPMYERLKMLFAFISTMGIGGAVILKLAMKLDWSGVLLLVSVSIFCFGFLPFYFYDLYRESARRVSE